MSQKDHPGMMRTTEAIQNTITNSFATLIQALCDIAESYHHLGRLEEASNVLHVGSLFLERAEVMPQDAVKMLLSYGKILIAKNFQLLSDYELTRPILLQAKSYAESIKDEKSLADALQLIGESYYFDEKLWLDQGDYETALLYFQQALELREALADQRGVSESLFYVGLLSERQHQVEKAFECYTKALEIATQGGYQSEKAEALRHLGGLYLQRQELEKARQYLAESLTIREESGLWLGLPWAYLALGYVDQEKGDLDQASVHYEAAYAWAEQMKLPAALIMVLVSMGDMHEKQGNRTQARVVFEKANTAAKEAHFHFALAVTSAKLEEGTMQGDT